MKKIKGFALLQALFFMMFIMAVISIAMMMRGQQAVDAEGERMATDAYPAVSAFVLYAQGVLTSPQTIKGSDYFAENPLSQTYIDTLVREGFSDPTKDSNLTITMTKT